MNMYWRDYFFYDTTNAADTWETIATAYYPDSVLQNFLVHNKHSGTIVFNARLVYNSVNHILSGDLSIVTKATQNFAMNTIDAKVVWGVAGTFHVPMGAEIQIKSDVLNSMDVMCTLRGYSQDKIIY